MLKTIKLPEVHDHPKLPMFPTNKEYPVVRTYEINWLISSDVIKPMKRIENPDEYFRKLREILGYPVTFVEQ